MSAEERLPSTSQGSAKIRVLTLADVLSVLAWIALVAGAIAEGQRMDHAFHFVYVTAAPLAGLWQRHAGPGTAPAIALGILGVLFAGRLARQLRWRQLLALSTVTSFAWTLSLAWVDGWHRGFSGQLERPGQYLSDVGRVRNLHAFLEGFTTHISAADPHPWTTHVAGHPPGALMLFVGLHAVGLGGGLWAGIVCVLFAAVGTAAVLVTVAACVSQESSRRLCPFLVFWPAAVFAGVSADALFMGVFAIGVALLAVGCRRSGHLRVWLVVTAGLVLGCTVYLSYGLVLLAPVVAVVLVRLSRPRDLLPLGVGAAVAPVLFALGGFSWWAGYHALHDRYYAGLGGVRPYHYWVWADLAALALALGPAIAPALVRTLGAVGRPSAWRSPDRASSVGLLLPVAALAGVMLATLSGLSKAEVERIWLPFMPWLIVACVLLPRRSTRGWLALQIAFAVGLQSAILSPW